MKLKGKVIDGLGNASFWIKKIEDVFQKKEHIKLFHGTLNIELKEEYNLESNWVIKPEEYGGTQKVYIQKCRVFGSKSYIVRPEQTAHKANIIEIISDINFREKYKLKNEDEIEIEL